MSNTKKYLAHVRKDDCEWKEHDLFEHLQHVALKAKQFADKFESGEWAYLTGLWHDLGKFSTEFQSYIRSKSGYGPEASTEDAERVNLQTREIHALQGRDESRP